MVRHSEIMPCEYWKVWRTADYLEQHGITMTKTAISSNKSYCKTSGPIKVLGKKDCKAASGDSVAAVENGSYQEITTAVIDVLRTWGHCWAGDPKWQSFLNKSRLLEEMEECIVALHHLLEWRKQRQRHQQDAIDISWVAVDVCCGKGLFAMLLSYLTRFFPNELQGLQRIILFDKATSATIDYHHIHVANSSWSQDGRPYLDIWEGCNLHDYDNLLDRLQSLSCPVALTGIHLCNMLSPACLGLANGLGPQICPYLCLAPCCLPRLARLHKGDHQNRTTCCPVAGAADPITDPDSSLNDAASVLSIHCFESTDARAERRQLEQQRAGARRRKRQLQVFPSHDERTTSKTGPIQLQSTSMNQSSPSSPCWKCGQMGHFKAQCPSQQTSSRPPRVIPPTKNVSVSHVWKSARPFETYCHALAQTLQDPICLYVVEAGIGKKDDYNHDDSKSDNGDLDEMVRPQHSSHGRNWNANRKNLFIVASR